MNAGYDVIGELRASPVRLDALLGHLGYERRGDGPYAHPAGRTAIFVGGVVGPHGTRVSCAPMVRDMVDAGSALMVLGPHELDVATGAATTARPRELVLAGAAAPPSSPSSPEPTPDDELVAWLRTVPLWLDLPGLRVVFACWSEFDVEQLRSDLGGNCLDADDHLALATDGSTRTAIDTLVHGPEVVLPERFHRVGADGVVRRTARYRWWGDGPMTLRARALVPAGSFDRSGRAHADLDDTPILDPMPVLFTDGAPVVVGRHWYPGAPVLRTPAVLSLDHTAQHPRQTTVYRWSGESELDPSRLVHLA
ncbi:MAG: hypothetical protein U0Q03_06120 [Acidimicrobiales bacterium]